MDVGLHTSMTKCRKKAPLGRVLNTDGKKKKRRDRRGGNSSLQNIISRASVGNPRIRENRGATAMPAYLLTELGAKPESPADKKNPP